MPDKEKKPASGGNAEQASNESNNIIDEKGNKIKGRTRNYACIIYPESAPDNFEEIIGEFRTQCFLSPLHCDDVNPGGEKKKDHYHLIVMFDSVKTMEQAKELFSKVGGVGCETVNSVRGYARYLCHLDNPEKAQYNPAHVRCYGGADYIDTINLASNKYQAIKEMVQWVKENNISSYMELFDYSMEHNESWFRVLCDNGTFVMKEYLRSKRFWGIDQSCYGRIDKSTGEIE